MSEMDYICPRCHRKFVKKSNLDRHLRRKIPCLIANSDDIFSKTLKNVESTPPTGVLEEFHSKNSSDPKNLRKSPVKLTKKSVKLTKKSRKIDEKLNNFELSQKTKLLKKIFQMPSQNFDPFQRQIQSILQTLPLPLPLPLPLDDENLGKYQCETCDRSFTRGDNLRRHQMSRCRGSNTETNTNTNTNANVRTSQVIDRSEIESLKTEIEKLKSQVCRQTLQTINNNLQVVCVGSDDNYLDMLTDKWGDFAQALNFIKDCALSSLNGDCKLLNKIYFDSKSSNEVPIRFLDKGRCNIEYYNEKSEKVIDRKGQKLGRILANNLQNSYLKGINYLTSPNLDLERSSKFLDDYDIQSWNSHIYELREDKYQKKIINHLDIPIVSK